MRYKFGYFLPLAFLITAIFMSVFVMLQQTLRQTAYDPQIQLSEDVAHNIATGNSFNSLLPADIELSQSSALFVIVYDKDGKITSSTATVNGLMPNLPPGVLSFAKVHGQDRLTWQPTDDMREATVVTHFSGKNEGYVLVGRSLRETERRIELTMKLAGFGWIVTFVGTFIASFLFIKSPNKK